MMSDPEILVLDEPTSGLDPNQIAEIRGIIKEIGKEKTVVFSTHILSEAEATCDRVVIINNGKIAADGTTSLLQDTTGKELAVRVTLQGPSFSELLSVVEHIPAVKQITEESIPSDDDNGNMVCARLTTDGDVRRQIYEKIKENPWTLLEFTQEKKSLEHIFRELTKE
jgi:ABC-2 type transport system ATP-binding protein